jgi:hypothetical protein
MKILPECQSERAVSRQLMKTLYETIKNYSSSSLIDLTSLFGFYYWPLLLLIHKLSACNGSDPHVRMNGDIAEATHKNKTLREQAIPVPL